MFKVENYFVKSNPKTPAVSRKQILFKMPAFKFLSYKN